MPASACRWLRPWTAAGVAGADEKDDQTRHLGECPGIDDPFAFDRPALVVDSHLGAMPPPTGWSRVDHHVQPGKPARESAVIAGCLSARPTVPSTTGAGVSSSTSCRKGSAERRRASPPAGAMTCRTLGGRRPNRPSVIPGWEDQGQRPRPEPPGQAAADLRYSRHPVGALLGSLDHECERLRAPACRPAVRAIPSACSCAGGECVDGLGCQPDHAPLSKGSDRLMDHVAADRRSGAVQSTGRLLRHQSSEPIIAAERRSTVSPARDCMSGDWLPDRIVAHHTRVPTGRETPSCQSKTLQKASTTPPCSRQ